MPRKQSKEQDKSRFWSMVDKFDDGCWIWGGKPNKTWYGVMMANRKHSYAHRYSWELHYGPIPKGINVCHKCDEPLCVNPDHLFLGTQKENMLDMKDKKRTAWGEKNIHAKLSESDVLEIRRLRKEKVSGEKVASLFNISRSHVYAIGTNVFWKNL